MASPVDPTLALGPARPSRPAARPSTGCDLPLPSTPCCLELQRQDYDLPHQFLLWLTTYIRGHPSKTCWPPTQAARGPSRALRPTQLGHESYVNEVVQAIHNQHQGQHHLHPFAFSWARRPVNLHWGPCKPIRGIRGAVALARQNPTSAVAF